MSSLTATSIIRPRFLCPDACGEPAPMILTILLALAFLTALLYPVVATEKGRRSMALVPARSIRSGLGADLGDDLPRTAPDSTRARRRHAVDRGCFQELGNYLRGLDVVNR